jgi:hypothetical protein
MLGGRARPESPSRSFQPSRRVASHGSALRRNSANPGCGREAAEGGGGGGQRGRAAGLRRRWVKEESGRLWRRRAEEGGRLRRRHRDGPSESARLPMRVWPLRRRDSATASVTAEGARPLSVRA